MVTKSMEALYDADINVEIHLGKISHWEGERSLQHS
jgi:hypothetical protein